MLKEWLDRGEQLRATPAGAAVFLIGLSHLALPLMPRFSTSLWQFLTGLESPALDGLEAVLADGLDPERLSGARPPVLEMLDPDRFAQCVSLNGVLMSAGV